MKPDVVLPCINGVFGNMNHIDAARLVKQAKPRYAIPCHYWTFAEQGGGDPGGFVYACKYFCPEVEAACFAGRGVYGRAAGGVVSGGKAGGRCSPGRPEGFSFSGC